MIEDPPIEIAISDASPDADESPKEKADDKVVHLRKPAGQRVIDTVKQLPQYVQEHNIETFVFIGMTKDSDVITGYCAPGEYNDRFRLVGALRVAEDVLLGDEPQ